MVEYELTAENQSNKEGKQEPAETAPPVDEKTAPVEGNAAPAGEEVQPDEEAIDDVAEAYFERGMQYSTGRDVIPDLVAAHKWFNLAAQRGHIAALSYRNDLAREMTSRQIAQAQREARAWIKAEEEAQAQAEAERETLAEEDARAQAEAASVAGAAMLAKVVSEAAKFETAGAKTAKTEAACAVA